MSFKVGDWVVRKVEQQCGFWTRGAKPQRVVEVSPSGHCLTLSGDGAGVTWDADFFNLVSKSHSDADLAMALQLADLLGQDYAQATFNSHDLCVMAREDWRVPEAEWLRDQVERELLNRGAR